MRHQFHAMNWGRRSELVNSIINEWEKASSGILLITDSRRPCRRLARWFTFSIIYVWRKNVALRIIPPFRPVFWRLIYLPISHSTNGLLQRKNDGKIHDDGWEIYWKFRYFFSTFRARSIVEWGTFFRGKMLLGRTSIVRRSWEREFSMGSDSRLGLRVRLGSVYCLLSVNLLQRQNLNLDVQNRARIAHS